MGFPRLTHNPVRYSGDRVKCSVCKKEMSYAETNQLWIALRVGTDVLPMLTNLCSKDCESKLPQPPKGYVQYAHKGGADLIQPSYKEWEEANVVKYSMDDLEKLKQKEGNKKPKLLKLIRKIWEK